MNLTAHEEKMLERLKKAGILNWTAIRADDTRTLNRLVKKGAARETVGRAGRRAWEPVTPTRNTNMDGADAPYPGMATAFEAHTGQSWTDPDWRTETAMWAAAWKAALLHNRR